MEIKSESVKGNKANQEFWLNHIKEWEHSKLSQGAYCKKADIKYSTFVYWRGQLLLESGQSKSQQFAPVKIKQEASDQSQSIKIKMTSGNVVCIPIAVIPTAMACILVKRIENISDNEPVNEFEKFKLNTIHLQDRI